jgi:competence protein ComFB
MLFAHRRDTFSSTQNTGTVHNYYERLVAESLLRQAPQASQDCDFIDDVSCVALNHLPPRYIRHDVDMSFYLSPIELDEITEKVHKAVEHALDFVKKREQDKKNLLDDDNNLESQ